MGKGFEDKLAEAKAGYNVALKTNALWKQKSQSLYARDYRGYAENSLAVAGLLFELSRNNERKAAMGVDPTFNGFMWVVVSSYFSMFYMASALLALKSIKVGPKDTHMHTKNAFLHLYIANHSLDRALAIDYAQSKELAEDLMAERGKRSKYQYNIGDAALQSDAEESIKRARNFFEKTRMMLK